MIFHDWSLLPTKPKPLNDYTWDEISEISASGKAASMFKVGDRKEIVLNGTVGALTFNNYHTYAFIIGFDHNAAVEGDHRIHFQLAKTALSGGTDICFVDSNYDSTGSSTGFRMNTSSANSGGWEDSYMRGNICGTSKSSTSGRFVGVIPSELRNVLKNVTKYTDNTGGGRGSVSNYVTATADYIFLLSEYEVFGTISGGNTYEANYQHQYAYYSVGNSKRKYQHNSAGTAAYWWLRSPNASTIHFRFINPNQGVGNGNASYSFGIAPCFCV